MSTIDHPDTQAIAAKLVEYGHRDANKPKRSHGMSDEERHRRTELRRSAEARLDDLRIEREFEL